MSYTNPKFYKEDYLAFSKSLTKGFDTHYGNAMDYYDDKIKAREEYETDLYAQADKMREEATAAENLSTEMQEKLEADIQKFLKEGLDVTDSKGRKLSEGGEDWGKGGGLKGFGGAGLKEHKKTQMDMDEANASFNAEVGAINKISDRAFVDNLHVHDDYDRGGETYLEYANVVKALQNNFGAGGEMNMNYKGKNKFGAGITIPNPRWTPETLEVKEDTPGATKNEDGKWVIPNPDYDAAANEGLEENLTYNASQIQALIGENDPEARAAIEENITTATTTLFNTAKSNLERRHEYGKSQMKPGDEGKFYSGDYSTEDVVTEWMNELQATDENDPNAPNTVNDIFNNKVNFNDKIRMEELSKVEGSEALTDLIMENGSINPQKADILDQLLDLPHNAISDQKRLLKRLGITDPNEAMQLLKGARNNMVHRYMVNEVIGQGIGSKSISPQAATPPGGNGSGSDLNSNDLRRISVQDDTSNILGKGGDLDKDKIVSNYSTFDEQKLLPRNVVKNDDGTYDFNVKEGNMLSNWWSYDDDKISEKDFQTYMNDPVFAQQYQDAIKGADYGEVDPSTMYSNMFDSSRLKEAEIKIDGGNRQIHDSQYDNETGQLTIYMQDDTNDPTAKNTKTYNLRTQNGYLSFYQDRMGAGTQKERDDLFQEGATQLVKDLIKNRFNTKGWGGNFPVEPLEMLDNNVIKSLYLTEKKIQDPKDYRAFYANANKELTEEQIDKHMEKIMEGSKEADTKNNTTYWDDLIREVLGK